MKLKNSALQDLYDTLVNGTFVCSVYARSPIDKAFEECDDKLSDSVTFATVKDLQDRNDILEESNKSLLAGNLNLSTEKNILKNRISRLEELLLDANATLEKVNADRNELQEAFDKLSGENNEITKNRDDAKKNVEYFRDCRDNWRARAKHAEKEVEDLASQYQKLTIENKRLRLEVNWYRKHFKEQSDKIQELKSSLNSVYGVYGDKYIKKIMDVARDDAYEHGQKDLWDRLRIVNDAKPFELATCFPDVSCMDDILSWDLEDFLNAYEKWQEEKDQERIKHMRDYLERFCRGRLCSRCPLGSDEYKCSCAYSFNGAHQIPDEDIKRYYEKARAFSKPMCHKDGWTCTLEGTINAEINKDLLNKVCGIDSDD